MLILSILLFQIIGFSYQWREHKYFECYIFESPIDKLLAGETEFVAEACPQTEFEQFFEGCYTRIINGIVYSGCMDRNYWEFSSLCFLDRRKREYTTDLDGLGYYMYDNIEVFCCTTPLCNDLQYFKTLYWAWKPIDRTYFTEMYTEGIIIFGICFLSMLYIIYELFDATPLFEDEPRIEYAVKNGKEPICD